jgi:ABC-type nickel/cobalt efflux system permease component RcnA
VTGGDRLCIAVVTLAALAATACIDPALAQTSPFGVGRPPAAAPSAPEATGVFGWLFAKQAEFYRSLSNLIRAMKADGSAVWALLGVSFLYGVFHAVGPGHGKAVISSYIVANDETWRRGVALSFASALLQAAVAVALVGIAAALLGATAKAMGDTVRWIELASYLLITALGAKLLWSKGQALLAALRSRQRGHSAPPALAGAPAGVTPHAHDHTHHHENHAHSPAHHHHHDDHCGHAHGPEPAALAGQGGWWRGVTAIFAVGLRPCSGAILVLVFALAQGLFWAGIAATFAMGLGTAIAVAVIATLAVSAKNLAARLVRGDAGGGAVAIRGLEVAAAALVFAFGALLLTGYMANERLFVM